MEINGGLADALACSLQMLVLLTCVLLASAWTHHHQPFSVGLMVQFKRWVPILVPRVWNVQSPPNNLEGTDRSPTSSSTPVAVYSSVRLTRSTLSIPSSEGISGVAVTMENVAIFDSPGKGRGLKATKEFWAGDVIFSEPSLAAVVFDR